MKILVVSPVIPWPLDRGNRVRIYNIIKELATKHKVTLVCTAERDYELLEEAKEKLKQISEHVHVITQLNKNIILRLILKILSEFEYCFFGKLRAEFYYNLWPFTRKVKKIIDKEKYDLIFTNYWFTAISPILNANIPTICDTHDVIWENNKRTLALKKYSILRNKIEQRRLDKICDREAKILNKHDLLICVTEKDVKTLREKLHVKTDCIIIPTIRSKEKYNYCFNNNSKQKILFYGALHSPMNIDAAKFVAVDILPRIRENIPNVELMIAGSGLSKEISYLQKLDGVLVLGYVPDIQKVFNEAKLLLLPLRSGSGIKGRVIEAMEAGLPVLGTDIAAEGIPVINGENMVIANGIEEITRWTIRLLQDENLRRKISDNARKFVEQNYSWENTYGKIHDIIILKNEVGVSKK